MPEDEELILKRRETRFEGSKPFCPKCNDDTEVVLTNVTLHKFECIRCKLKFAITEW